MGLLTISGWHGASAYRVAIVGWTAKRTRICALQDLRLAGRGRTLRAGEVALVPRTAVRIIGRIVDDSEIAAIVSDWRNGLLDSWNSKIIGCG